MQLQARFQRRFRHQDVAAAGQRARRGNPAIQLASAGPAIFLRLRSAAISFGQRDGRNNRPPKECAAHPAARPAGGVSRTPSAAVSWWRPWRRPTRPARWPVSRPALLHRFCPAPAALRPQSPAPNSHTSCRIRHFPQSLARQILRRALLARQQEKRGGIDQGIVAAEAAIDGFIGVGGLDQRITARIGGRFQCNVLETARFQRGDVARHVGRQRVQRHIRQPLAKALQPGSRRRAPPAASASTKR